MNMYVPLCDRKTAVRHFVLTRTHGFCLLPLTVACLALKILEHTVNLKRSRPGDVVNIPYEVTVGHG